MSNIDRSNPQIELEFDTTNLPYNVNDLLHIIFYNKNGEGFFDAFYKNKLDYHGTVDLDVIKKLGAKLEFLYGSHVKEKEGNFITIHKLFTVVF